MFEENGPIPRVPTFVPAAEQLTFEALYMAAISIEAAYVQMQSIALQVSGSVGDKPGFRAAFFANAWAMIDNFYMLTNLDKKIIKSDAFNEYCKLYSDAAFQRNRFRHLTDNIKNAAKSKRGPEAVFGKISFHLAVPNDRRDLTRGCQPVFHVMNGGGQLPPFNIEAEIPKFPSPGSYWLHDCKLTAFGKCVNLTSLLMDGQVAMAATAKAIYDRIVEEARSLAIKEGKPLEEILQRYPPPMFFTIKPRLPSD